jgi:hypothetical protein
MLATVLSMPPEFICFSHQWLYREHPALQSDRYGALLEKTCIFTSLQSAKKLVLLNPVWATWRLGSDSPVRTWKLTTTADVAGGWRTDTGLQLRQSAGGRLAAAVSKPPSRLKTEITLTFPAQFLNEMGQTRFSTA